MKIVMSALAAVLLTGIGWSAVAEAQALPQGSYLQSCNGARIQGGTLVARCRTVDGRVQRSALASVRRCVGDIGNNNGQLQCNYGGPRAQGAPVPDRGERGYGERGYGERGRGERGYGERGYGERGYGERGNGERGYGDRRYGEQGYGSDRGGRCWGLRRQSEELRARLDREWNPLERARTEGQLRAVREQAERCRY